MLNGQVPEWSIGAVLKTVVAQATEGSNPSLSATHLLDDRRVLFTLKLPRPMPRPPEPICRRTHNKVACPTAASDRTDQSTDTA